MSRPFRWIAGILFIAQSAFAYTLTTAPSGQPIRWRYGQKLFLAGNFQGKDKLSPDFFYQSVVNGLQQWKWASGSQFDFEYWQGNDAKIYDASLKQNGLSSIFFASNSAEASDPNIIGFTQVWYNNDSGDLIETDIMLNDRHYELTDQVSDTSAGTVPWGARPKVYLGNIITHELGHAIGLSHSGNINASMLYIEYPEQSKLGCDDRAAARHLYAPSDHLTGALSGSVLSPTGEGVSGAVVNAISKSRGVVLASVLTDQSGIFHFGALDEGDTGLVIQPFEGSNFSIPPEVQTRDQVLCGVGSFPTFFVTEEDSHTLRSFNVTADHETRTAPLHVQCDEITQAAAYPASASSEFLVDTGRVGTSKTYLFEAHGLFSLSGLSYLFLSAVKVDFEVRDSSGRRVALQKEAPIYQSPSQFKIPDTRISGWAQGTLSVKVTPTLIASGEYPIPAVYPTGIPYYVLAFDSRGGALAASDARCSAPETFALYRSPATDPVRFGATTASRDGIGFCGGTAHAGEIRSSLTRPKRNAALGSIVGWFFPFLVAIASQLYSKRRRAKLKAR